MWTVLCGLKCLCNVWQVYGGRELLDHEVVGRLAASQDNLPQGHLHILLNCNDLDWAQLGISNAEQRPSSALQGALPRSALTASVAASPLPERKRSRPR